jgi:hypothetical protein
VTETCARGPQNCARCGVVTCASCARLVFRIATRTGAAEDGHRRIVHRYEVSA